MVRNILDNYFQNKTISFGPFELFSFHFSSVEETYDCQSNNPCLKADDPDFRTFYSHTNANKFIQCTGHEGGCYEMPCPATLVWNPSSNICAPLSLIPLNSIY